MLLTWGSGHLRLDVVNQIALIGAYLMVTALIVGILSRNRRPITIMVVVVLVFVTVFLTMGMPPFTALAVVLAAGLAAGRIIRRVES